MKSRWSSFLIFTAASAAVLALTACGRYGYPTMSDAVCGVSGIGCRPECHAVAMPTADADAKAVSYQIGPTSCPERTVSEAQRDAEQTCADRGLTLAATAPERSQQPAVGPLPPTQAVTFHCQG